MSASRLDRAAGAHGPLPFTSQVIHITQKRGSTAHRVPGTSDDTPVLITRQARSPHPRRRHACSDGRHVPVHTSTEYGALGCTRNTCTDTDTADLEIYSRRKHELPAVCSENGISVIIAHNHVVWRKPHSKCVYRDLPAPLQHVNDRVGQFRCHLVCFGTIADKMHRLSNPHTGGCDFGVTGVHGQTRRPACTCSPWCVRSQRPVVPSDVHTPLIRVCGESPDE